MKKFIVFIFLIIFMVGIVFFINNTLKSKKNLEKNLESEKFLISKIKSYSSAMTINNNTNYKNPEWDLNIYQYTDIAIYLERISDDNSYIKRLYIDNINIGNLKRRSS